MRCWVGTEKEGKHLGVKTLFVENYDVISYRKIVDLAIKYNCSKIYLGAGRTYTAFIDDPIKFVNECVNKNIKITIELDTNFNVSKYLLSDLYNVEIILTILKKGLKFRAVDTIKFDDFNDVNLIYISRTAFKTNLDTLNEDNLFEDDVIVYEEEE